MKGYRLNGQVLGVLLGLETKSLVTTHCAEITVTFEGIDGDKHRGYTRGADGRTPYYKRGTPIRNIRQVSIVSQEDLHAVAAALDLPEICPEWLGANLLLSGIPDLTLLPPSTRLVFSKGAVLRVEEENMPCMGPGRVIAGQYANEKLASRFVKAAYHRRGVVATVELPGTIAVGDTVTLEVPEQIIYKPDRSEAA
jgi:hypothetical protein